MIATAFKLLVSQLNTYIQSLTDPPATTEEASMANIAVLDTFSDTIDTPPHGIILSLVNIEEEATMKNRSHYSRVNINDITYQNAPVFLNLYILITAYYTKYDSALIRLSNVIQFFQSKSTFSIRNTPFTPANSDEENIELFLDMHSLTFEQLNHLWGSLGGKQWPAVLYKARLVRIAENRTTGIATVIEKITTTETIVTPQ